MKQFEMGVHPEYCFFPRYEVYVSEQWLTDNDIQEYIYVEISSGVKRLRCLLRKMDQDIQEKIRLQNNQLQLTGSVKRELGTIQAVTLTILPNEKVVKRKPKVEELRSPYLRASRAIISKYGNDVELINATTGYRKFVTLKESSTYTNDYSIGFNRNDSLLLDSNEKNVAQSNIIIQKNYDLSKPHIISKLISNINQYLGRTFVGYREIELRVGYVYPFDEGYDVVRMHPESAKILGVSESDVIKVICNGKIIKQSVLFLNEEHIDKMTRFNQDKQFIDVHVTIGLNAMAKNKLNIPNPGAIIKVRRSTKFVFKRHLNKLILPMIALLFTIFQLGDSYAGHEVLIMATITGIITPIIIFTALSEERSRVK